MVDTTWTKWSKSASPIRELTERDTMQTHLCPTPVVFLPKMFNMNLMIKQLDKMTANILSHDWPEVVKSGMS